jgi:hypothetical protein
MACPWFYPVERLGAAESIMPLGDVWGGECRAPGLAQAEFERRFVIDCCNLGYARAKCRRFPAGAGPDAVRFAITNHCEASISVCCVSEKDYLPFARISLEYDVAAGRFMAPGPDAVLERQAWAYVSTFLLRTQSAC